MSTFSYRGLGFIKHGPPTDPKAIAKLEKKLGARFPEDYRQFLLAMDGGVAEDYRGLLVSVREQPKMQDILEFYTVSQDQGHDILGELVGYDFNQRVPDFIIPIGRFIGDYMLCISLRKEDYGRMYIWAPRELWNTEDEVLIKFERDLFFLANSFNEFLDKLQPIAEE